VTDLDLKRILVAGTPVEAQTKAGCDPATTPAKVEDKS
jgi:hypothetical protein